MGPCAFRTCFSGWRRPPKLHILLGQKSSVWGGIQNLSSLSFREAYEGSTEERNGEAVEGRGSIVKYWETAFAESNENLSEYLGYGWLDFKIKLQKYNPSAWLDQPVRSAKIKTLTEDETQTGWTNIRLQIRECASEDYFPKFS